MTPKRIAEIEADLTNTSRLPMATMRELLAAVKQAEDNEKAAFIAGYDAGIAGDHEFTIDMDAIYAFAAWKAGRK